MAKESTYSIACVPGDGIGTEIVEQATKVLNCLASISGAVSFSLTTFDWSSKTYAQTGSYMPDDWKQKVAEHDAILFGAVGWPTIPDHISLWGMILPMRTALNQFVNIRPMRILEGTQSPLLSCQGKAEVLDWVIVRENSEGEYAGQGGITHAHTPHAVATDVSIFTRVAIERIMRFAFETAKNRPRKKLTLVTKSNAQRHGMVLWDMIFDEIAKDYEGQVECDKMLVDAMTVRMVKAPHSIDTVVATNLHADILSDLAAALAGSIGIAPSSSLDPTRQYPSLFEPIHGSAPDIAGRGVANPIGTLWSAAEMVRWVGRGKLDDLADMLMNAIQNVLKEGIKTPDMSGSASTSEVGDAICDELRRIAER